MCGDDACFKSSEGGFDPGPAPVGVRKNDRWCSDLLSSCIGRRRHEQVEDGLKPAGNQRVDRC